MTNQTEFRAGLLDPQTPTPKGLYGPQGAASGKRYDVYRNNVTYALIEALKSAFPFVQKLLGPKHFLDLAPAYVRAHPPVSPLMMFYGAEFPTFLESAPEVSEIGYVADAARLDLGIRRAYHAADAPILQAADLQKMPPDTLMNASFRPAPATQILRSRWPIFDIWRFSFQESAPQPRPQAQDNLITRPDFDPAPHLLPHGAADWLDTMGAGQDFGQTHETTLAAHRDFDLQATLTLMLSSGALTTSSARN